MMAIIMPIGAIAQAHNIVKNDINKEYKIKDINFTYDVGIIGRIDFTAFNFITEDFKVENIERKSFAYRHIIKVSSEECSKGIDDFCKEYIKKYENSVDWKYIKEK